MVKPLEQKKKKFDESTRTLCRGRYEKYHIIQLHSPLLPKIEAVALLYLAFTNPCLWRRFGAPSLLSDDIQNGGAEIATELCRTIGVTERAGNINVFRKNFLFELIHS